MKLLLFDIDGTLLDAFGAGREAVEAAFRDVTGRAIDSGGVSFSGKTDPQIARELLAETLGRDDSTSEDLDALVWRVLDRYAERLAASLPRQQRPPEAMPGVRALLDVLSGRDDVQLALLTGNLQRTARLKTQAAGLNDYFPFGAFSSDEADRDRLVPVATRRAETHTGRAFGGSDVVVIGDTPRDVQCGAAHGARTVAVCTGRYAREDLGSADAVFADLSDARRFVETVVEKA